MSDTFRQKRNKKGQPKLPCKYNNILDNPSDKKQRAALAAL